MKKTLLSIPKDLLESARKASGASTKSQTVRIALEEYVRDKKLGRLMERAGQGFGLSLNKLLKSRAKG